MLNMSHVAALHIPLGSGGGIDKADEVALQINVILEMHAATDMARSLQRKCTLCTRAAEGRMQHLSYGCNYRKGQHDAWETHHNSADP